MSLQPAERAVLDNVVADLRADGFDVYIGPSRPITPEFFGNIQPDAIGFRADRKVVVEVLQPGPASGHKLETLRKILADHKDWELRVYWVSASDRSEPLDAVSEEAIAQTLESLRRLIQEDQRAPALLTGWATLEALGRKLMPLKFQRPQTPGRLAEVLAGEGYLTPREADLLRSLATARNKFIHGDLKVSVSEDDLDRFVSILETLSRWRAPETVA